MYRILVVGGAVADPERFVQLLGRMRPHPLEAVFTDEGEADWKKAAEVRPDLLVLEVAAAGEGAAEEVGLWKSRQPQAKIVAVQTGGADAGSEGMTEAAWSGAVPGPLLPEEAAALLGALAAELETERRARAAELRLAEKTMEFMPLAEQQIVLTLMQQEAAGEEGAVLAGLGTLFTGLGLGPIYGRAAVILLPEAGGAPELPPGMGAGQLYEAVRSRAKADGEFAVVGPLVGRWLAVLRLGAHPQAEAPDFGESCRPWAEGLAGFLKGQLGLSCTIGLGGLGEGAAGLRQSLLEAAAALEEEAGSGSGTAAAPWAASGEKLAQEIRLLQEERERRIHVEQQAELPSAAVLQAAAGASAAAFPDPAGGQPGPSGALDAPFLPAGR
ncbi:hypothetical protein [Paenibacillus sp. KR2-11]